MSNSKPFLLFFVLSIALYFLSNKIFPKSSVSCPNVPIIKAPAGQIMGAELKTNYVISSSADHAMDKKLWYGLQIHINFLLKKSSDEKLS